MIINKQMIIIVILILLVIVTVIYNKTEYFTTDNEALSNISSLYNSSNFTLTNAAISQNLNVGGLTQLNNNLTVSGLTQLGNLPSII